MELKIVLFLPRDAASVPLSRQVLTNCLETLGVTRDTRNDIALALSEACANVIQHAGPGDEYEVEASVHNGRCIIEVINTGTAALTTPDSEPAPLTAEHGRGLQIIDAVADNLQLTGNGRGGTTTVHFEKTLDFVPDAAGAELIASQH